MVWPAFYSHVFQAFQKEIQANAITLANVVSAIEEFLEKNGDKLQPEEKAAMEKKLTEAKLKLSALSEKVDTDIKNLDKAVTTALKQETEKVLIIFLYSLVMTNLVPLAISDRSM